MEDPVTAEVAQLVGALYTALSVGDKAWVAEHVLLDEHAVHIGWGAAHWRNARELLDGLQEQFASVQMQWRMTEPVVLHRGDAVCVVDRPVIGFDDGSELPCRVTLVFFDEGGWKLAHSHLSVGS